MTQKKLNSAKGVTSFDIKVGNSTVAFFNKNISSYPTEAGGTPFELVPVTQQKDIMRNNARLLAQQEHARIMELVTVLQRQADDIQRRLHITDAVHAAEYQFQPAMGHSYWLVWDQTQQRTQLIHLGPEEWTTAAPENYQYLAQVRFLGDHSWQEILDLSH